jgi:hypothetical protein
MVKNIVSILLVAIFFFCNMAFAEHAIVINDNQCIILDGNGDEIFPEDDAHNITTSQNSHYICEADVTPPPGGQAVHFDYGNTGLTCGDGNFIWHETVSANGHAVVVCLITPP